MHQKGYSIHVATNQAGVGRGLLTESSLSAIHDKMSTMIAAAGGKLSSIHYCPHHPKDKCKCRKPAPGLLYEIATESGIDITQIPYVGDSLKDIQAAEAAGCKAVLVLTGNGAETRKHRPGLDHVYDDLLAFAKKLIAI